MAKFNDDERFCFIVEWYEDLAARIRQFQFCYFVESMAVEMYDIKNRRLFLRTSVKDNNLKLSDLYIGNSINVCGRLLNVVEYGDEYTRRNLAPQTERTLCLIKPDAVNKLGPILDTIWQRGFLISRLRMCTIDHQQAMALYQEHVGKPYLRDLLDCAMSGPAVAFEMVANRAVSAWREMIGPPDPSQARSEAPSSIRAQYGTDVIYNAVHGSDSPESAARELELFFPSQGPIPPNTAQVGNCTCCVIKPSAIKAGIGGKIITAITDAGFEVGAAGIFTLEKANAEEFLEVYRGVVHEYSGMVTEMMSGPCLALEIKAPDDASPVGPAFRTLAGPADPEIARHLRPNTLRALFGTDKVRNAVHCTDLPEDGQLEVEYFFRILDRR